MTRLQAWMVALVVLGGSAALAQGLAEGMAPGGGQPAAADSARLATERLRRARVIDADGAGLGAITDFVLTPAGASGGAGQISHVVLELGGVMGLGRHAVAVPYSELRITGTEDGALRIRLPWTEAQLRSVPAWDPVNPATLGLSGPSDLAKGAADAGEAP